MIGRKRVVKRKVFSEMVAGQNQIKNQRKLFQH